MSALHNTTHAEEAALAAVSKHGEHNGSVTLGLHEFGELALQCNVVTHVELLDGGAREADEDGDQIELTLGFVGGDLLSCKHVGDERTSNLKRNNLFAFVFDRLFEHDLCRCLSHFFRFLLKAIRQYNAFGCIFGIILRVARQQPTIFGDGYASVKTCKVVTTLIRLAQRNSESAFSAPHRGATENLTKLTTCRSRSAGFALDCVCVWLALTACGAPASMAQAHDDVVCGDLHLHIMPDTNHIISTSGDWFLFQVFRNEGGQEIPILAGLPFSPSIPGARCFDGSVLVVVFLPASGDPSAYIVFQDGSRSLELLEGDEYELRDAHIIIPPRLRLPKSARERMPAQYRSLFNFGER